MKRADLDPHVGVPEYADDHHYWVAVLSVARELDSELYGLLHGMRCGGARLERRINRIGVPTFRLRYEALLRVWDEQVLRKRWLDPQREGIVRAFAGATEILGDAEAMARLEVS